MHRRHPLHLGLCALMLLAATLPAIAETTWQRVARTGNIVIGYRESSIPFSYLDAQGRPQGYAIDLCRHLVDALNKRLGRELRREYRPVTSANRITLLQNGTVDIECGSTTNNLERQKQVGFSTTIFVIGTKLMTKKGSGINDFADLAGKNVVTTAGTTSERLIRKMNEEKQMKMNVISAKDHGESFLTLETGRAVAFMMDDALLYGEMAKAKKPGDWAVVGTAQSKEAYGCMLRKDDAEFKKVVDAALTKAMTSGDAEKIYNKWFMNPIPPKGLNLSMPLSAEMKALYKAPNDKAFE